MHWFVYIGPMYIEIVSNRNSRPAILLREAWREGRTTVKRTLANLSDWPESQVESLPRVLVDVMHYADVGMVPRGRWRQGLLETSECLPVLVQFRSQELQRDRVAQPRVLRSINHPHRAAADAREHAIVRNRLTNQIGRWSLEGRRGHLLGQRGHSPTGIMRECWGRMGYQIPSRMPSVSPRSRVRRCATR